MYYHSFWCRSCGTIAVKSCSLMFSYLEKKGHCMGLDVCLWCWFSEESTYLVAHHHLTLPESHVSLLSYLISLVALFFYGRKSLGGFWLPLHQCNAAIKIFGNDDLFLLCIFYSATNYVFINVCIVIIFGVSHRLFLVFKIMYILIYNMYN